MRFKLAVAATAATMAFGGVALASANSGGSSDDHGGQTIFAVTVQTTDIDLGATGFSLGDQQVFSDDLSARKGASTLGTDGGVCTIVRVTDAKKFAGTAQCVVTLSLPGGQIALQGLVTFTGDDLPEPFDIAVTGGTGDYRDASGQATVEELNDTDANLTLHLSDNSGR
jgi:hypothetical protein